MTTEAISTQIKLDPIPNQSFSITLDGRFYDILIKEANGVMSCSITRDNVVIQENARMSAGYLLIPYKYQENGNFFIVTENEDYPYYTEFGNTQFLMYMPQSILNALHAEDLNYSGDDVIPF
jgi:hypothetical protein